MAEVPDGTFTWRIENFQDKSMFNLTSSEFNIGKYASYLGIQKNVYVRYLGHIVSVFYLNSKIDETSQDNIYFILCLINDHGDEFLMTLQSGISRNNCFIPLMTIDVDDLYMEKYNLLPDGALTLRLSWGEKEGRIFRDEDTKTGSDLNSGVDSAKLFEKLGKDLGTFYESKTLTDCVLIVGNEQFAVHRAVLAARSPVFAAMFDHDTSEKRSGEVVIQGVDPAVLSDVLYYVYSGQVRGLTTDTAAPMYIVADKYAFTEMKDICLDFLMSNLTIDNVSDAAVVAHAHGESALANEVAKHIELNSEELVENERWKEFYQSNPYLAIKYLHSALITGNKHKPQKLK